MLGNFDMIAIVVVLLGLVFAGAHIAIALGITAALGLYSDDWRHGGGSHLHGQHRL